MFFPNDVASAFLTTAQPVSPPHRSGPCNLLILVVICSERRSRTLWQHIDQIKNSPTRSACSSSASVRFGFCAAHGNFNGGSHRSGNDDTPLLPLYDDLSCHRCGSDFKSGRSAMPWLLLWLLGDNARQRTNGTPSKGEWKKKEGRALSLSLSLSLSQKCAVKKSTFWLFLFPNVSSSREGRWRRRYGVL